MAHIYMKTCMCMLDDLRQDLVRWQCLLYLFVLVFLHYVLCVKSHSVPRKCLIVVIKYPIFNNVYYLQEPKEITPTQLSQLSIVY